MSGPWPKTVLWERLEYGKLVERPEGPIVHGSEHGPTGQTAGFPAGLIRHCRPGGLDVGELNTELWQKCPWARTGGIATGTFYEDGGHWVMAVRMRQRSESGEDTPGRLYSEAQYLAMPQNDFHFGCLVGLESILYAEPLLAIDRDLPLLEVPILSEETELPSDWLDRIRLSLAGVMSGVSVSYQDWETGVGDFLWHVTLCLAAIPRTLHWRLPLGAGLISLDGSRAVGSGMKVLAGTGIRIINSEVKNKSEFDLEVGEGYVDWLAGVAGSSATLGELVERVAQELPMLDALDAIPLETPWAQAASDAARTAHERQRAAQFLDALDRGESASPPSLALQVNRERLLGELGSRLGEEDGGRILSALAGTVEWSDAWEGFLRNASGEERPARRGAACLLGIVRAPSRADLLAASRIGLPEALKEKVFQNLASVAAESESGTDWLALIEGEPSLAWVGEWRSRATPHLVWLGWKEALRSPSPDPRLLRALCEDPSSDEMSASLALLEKEPPSTASLDALLRLARAENGPVVRTLVQSVREWSAWTALYIDQRAQESRALSAPTPLPSLSRKELPVLAEALLEDPRRAVAGSVREILSGFSDLQKAPFTRELRRWLAPRIGQPYSAALWGRAEPEQPEAEFRHVAHEIVRGRMSEDPSVLENLVDAYLGLQDAPRARAMELLRSWRQARGAVGAAAGAVARGLAVLCGHGSAPAPEELTPDEREILRSILSDLKVDATTMARYAETEPLLSVVVPLWQGRQPMPISARQTARIIRAVVFDNALEAWWNERIDVMGWGRQGGWRLIRSGQCREVAEEDALRLLNPTLRLWLWVYKMEVPADLLEDVTVEDVETVLERDRDLGRIRDRILDAVGKIKHSRGQGLLRTLGVWSVRLVKKRRYPLSDAEEAVRGSGLRGKIFSGRSRMDPALELMSGIVTRQKEMSPVDFVDNYWGSEGASRRTKPR